MNQAMSFPTMEDLKNTQVLIECCLQRYMNEGETIAVLQREKGIDPLLTHLVWQQLEGQNQIFFNEYYFRLVLMEQFMAFNKLTAIEAQKNTSSVAQHEPANALCNGGPWTTSMGNGDGFNGITSNQNGKCQGMNGMDESLVTVGGAPSLGFPVPEYGFINQAPPNYSGSNIMPQGTSVAPCLTSNNLRLMEQQQFNMPTKVDGFMGRPDCSDQAFSGPTVNGVPEDEARASYHASGVQNIHNEFVGIPSSSQYFM